MEAVIGTGSGDTHQFELEDPQVQALTGMKIGEEVDGSVLGLDGYTLEITGGSDTEGFPMRESVEGTQRKELLVEEGTGARDLEQGERKRKSVRGNTVSRQISQLNLRVVGEGEESIESVLGEEPEEGETGEETDEERATEEDSEETGEEEGEGEEE
ncbi:MAG: 30S ribosomal protein S6e [Candidatus Nanohaloarchaea archaeon]|nr:30S ribosomal protein S6e [Candidatus Nanohaloarchaea archaeon]